MLRVAADSLRGAWENVNYAILENPKELVENCSSNAAFIDGIELDIGWAKGDDLDLGEIGYTKAKWTHLLKGYFFPESYYKALAAAQEYLGKKQRPPVGIIFYGERLTKESVGIASSAGPCLLSMSFSWRYDNPTPRVFVHSRSSDVSKKFYADCCFIYTIIRSFAADLGFDHTRVTIEWRIDRALQSVDYLPVYLLKTFGIEDPDELHTVFTDIDHKWWKHIIKAWPDENTTSKYLTRQRAIDDYWKEINGVARPRVPASELVLPYA